MKWVAFSWTVYLDMIFFSNVPSNFQPAEDVDKRDEKENGSYDTVDGVWFLGVPGVSVAREKVRNYTWKREQIHILRIHA